MMKLKQLPEIRAYAAVPVTAGIGSLHIRRVPGGSKRYQVATFVIIPGVAITEQIPLCAPTSFQKCVLIAAMLLQDSRSFEDEANA